MAPKGRVTRGLWKASTLALSVLALLALVALACAPAEPEAAPAPQQPQQVEQAAPAPASVTQPEAPLALPAGYRWGETPAPPGGVTVERAGLRIFIPEGALYAGPTVPRDPREPRYGGIANRGMAGDPPSVDPSHTLGTYLSQSVFYDYDKLVEVPHGPGVDPFKQVVQGALAESWEISNDYLTYTFHLRKGVKFHNVPPVNGREMDSQDVKFTFDLYMRPDSIARGAFADVERVEAPDRSTFVIHMKQVSPGFLTTLTEWGKGWMLPREAAEYNRRTTTIGTGPFIAQGEYQYKVGIKHRRNPDSWRRDAEGRQMPFLDGIHVFVMPDSAARLTAFRTGKIDDGASVANPEQLRALLRTNPTTLFQEANASVASMTGYAFRLDKEPWSDVLVRRALSLALDYDTISQTIFQDPFNGSVTFQALWGGLRDTSLKTITELCQCPWYTYDPQRAKELLAEAGFPKGLKTTIETFPYSQAEVEKAEMMIAYWQAIGVEAKLSTPDYTVWIKNNLQGLWENVARTFITPSPSSADTMVNTLLPGKGGNTQQGNLNDPVLTKMVEEFHAAFPDDEKRRQIYRRIHAYYLDQVYTLADPRGLTPSPFAPRLRNFQPIAAVATYSELSPWMHTWIDDAWAFNK